MNITLVAKEVDISPATAYQIFLNIELQESEVESMISQHYDKLERFLLDQIQERSPEKLLDWAKENNVADILDWAVENHKEELKNLIE